MIETANELTLHLTAAVALARESEESGRAPAHKVGDPSVSVMPSNPT